MASRRSFSAPPGARSDEEDVDLALRQVTRARPLDLLEGLWPQGPAGRSVRWIETQLAQRQRRLDRLLEVRGGGERRWLHVEWQLAWTKDVPRRMFEYHVLAALAAQAEALPRLTIESVVVLLSGRQAPWPAEQRFRTSLPGAPFSGVRFRLEAVYQKTVEELLTWGGFGRLFAPLALDADASTVTEATTWWKHHAASREELADLGAAMAVLAEADGQGRGLGRAVLAVLDSKLVTQSSIYSMGKTQGLREGKAESKLEGEAESVLEARGLEVSSAARKRVGECADASQLDHWLRRAAVVGAVRELFD